MEHRCTPRMSADLKILISKHNVPIAIGRIRNGSHSGIFVETEFEDIDCEQLLKLEVVHSKNQSKRATPLEMQALVIHKSANGFGAEIEFANEELSKDFIELLKGDKTIPVETVDVRTVVNQ